MLRNANKQPIQNPANGMDRHVINVQLHFGLFVGYNCWEIKTEFW